MLINSTISVNYVRLNVLMLECLIFAAGWICIIMQKTTELLTYCQRQLHSIMKHPWDFNHNIETHITSWQHSAERLTAEAGLLASDSKLQHYVLLFQSLVIVLQVFYVVDSFAQHSRLVQLTNTTNRPTNQSINQSKYHIIYSACQQHKLRAITYLILCTLLQSGWKKQS